MERNYGNKYQKIIFLGQFFTTTVKIGGNRQEEFRNEILETNTKKIYFLVNFSRFLGSRPISGLHFNELIKYSAPFTFHAFALPSSYVEHYLILFVIMFLFSPVVRTAVIHFLIHKDFTRIRNTISETENVVHEYLFLHLYSFLEASVLQIYIVYILLVWSNF